MPNFDWKKEAENLLDNAIIETLCLPGERTAEDLLPIFQVTREKVISVCAEYTKHRNVVEGRCYLCGLAVPQ